MANVFGLFYKDATIFVSLMLRAMRRNRRNVIVIFVMLH